MCQGTFLPLLITRVSFQDKDTPLSLTTALKTWLRDFFFTNRKSSPNSKEVPTSTKGNGYRTEYRKPTMEVTLEMFHSSNMELKGGLKLPVNEQKCTSDIYQRRESSERPRDSEQTSKVFPIQWPIL